MSLIEYYPLIVAFLGTLLLFSALIIIGSLILSRHYTQVLAPFGPQFPSYVIMTICSIVMLVGMDILTSWFDVSYPGQQFPIQIRTLVTTPALLLLTLSFCLAARRIASWTPPGPTVPENHPKACNGLSDELGDRDENVSAIPPATHKAGRDEHAVPDRSAGTKHSLSETQFPRLPAPSSVPVVA